MMSIKKIYIFFKIFSGVAIIVLVTVYRIATIYIHLGRLFGSCVESVAARKKTINKNTTSS